MTAIPAIKSDAVILTAVSVEAEAVRQCFDGWKKVPVPGNSQEYYETVLRRGGRDLRLITACQPVMGMTAATLLAAKAVNLFCPQYLIMCGIAAGTGNDVKQMMGDVLVPDVVWNYSMGKYVGPDKSDIHFGEIGFLPRPISLCLDDEIKAIVEKTKRLPDNECHVHIGPIICGDSVIANTKFVQTQLRVLVPQMIGLDMESFAVFFVAEHISEPRPRALVVKSICDFAREDKDDRFQKFAAYTSCQYVRYLLEKHLPFS